MAYISRALRELVIQRAGGQCEYCQTQQLIVIDMVIDHIIPEAVGGTTPEDNLCFCCSGCNSFKQAFQFGIDAETGETVPLYNPRAQDWRDHLEWSEDGTRIVGKSKTGRATIVRLKMNREIAVAARREWVAAGWHPPNGRH